MQANGVLTTKLMELKGKITELEGQPAPAPRGVVATTAPQEITLLREENAQIKQKLKATEGENAQLKNRIKELEALAAQGEAALAERAKLMRESQQLRSDNSRLLRGRSMSPEMLRAQPPKEPVAALASSVGSLLADRLPSQAQALAWARQREPTIKRSTDMPPEMQRRALNCARSALATTKDFTALADAVKAGFQSWYGSAWQCVVGLDAHTGFSVWRASEAYLNVTFGEVKIMLFKAGPEPRAELVAKARNEEAVVRESTMPPPMQAKVVESGRKALSSFIRFNDMVKAINEDLKAALGGVWQCVVAEEGHVGFTFRHLHSPYLYMAFGKVCMIMLKAGHLPPGELLAVASALEPEVVACTLPQAAEQRALQCARAALAEHPDFTTVARHVRNGMSSGCGGAWDVVAGVDVHLGHSTGEALLEVKFGDVQLRVLRAQGGPEPHAGILARASVGEVDIEETTMPPAMQERALIDARAALARATNFDQVAAALQESFEEAYGGVWNCVVATEMDLAFRLQHTGPTYLHAIFGSMAMVLYKTSEMSQADILAVAKSAEDEILCSSVPPPVEECALAGARVALAAHREFAGVAEAVMGSLVHAVGGVWRCVVGMDVHFGCWVRYADEAYLEVRFGELRMVVFKAGNVPQADLIAAARDQEPVVRASSVPPGVEPLALQSTKAALARHGDLNAIAEEVKDTVVQGFGGVWHLALGVDRQFGAAFAPSGDAYLECSFGELEMVLFQAAGGAPGAHAGAAAIIAMSRGSTPVIIKSTVRDDVRQYALEKSQAELCCHTDFGSIASAVHEDLNKVCGGGWQCVVGLGAHYGSWVSAAPEGWLDVKFGEVHMAMFRASRHCSQAEIIEGAQTEQAIVRKTTLSKEQQTRAIQGALKMFGEHLRFGDVAKAIREDFIGEYGGVWHVIVAVAEHAGFSVWPANEGYLNVLFGEVEMILFKAYTNWF